MADGKKVFQLCLENIDDCHEVGSLAIDKTYSPPAWAGATKVATRIDDTTCRLEVMYATALRVHVSNFAPRNFVRYRRSFYEADYEKHGSASCLSSDYTGEMACRYEEIIEAY